MTPSPEPTMKGLRDFMVKTLDSHGNILEAIGSQVTEAQVFLKDLGTRMTAMEQGAIRGQYVTEPLTLKPNLLPKSSAAGTSHTFLPPSAVWAKHVNAAQINANAGGHHVALLPNKPPTFSGTENENINGWFNHFGD